MITVDGVTKVYRENKAVARAIEGISFTVPEGSFFTLLGPSGCGKTTTLRCVAGLEEPDEGRIRIGADTVFDSEAGVNTPIQHRDIGMVFQSYAIWPHMTVFDVAAFPLRVSKTRRFTSGEIAERVAQVLGTVGLGDYIKRMATQLSGGQQQRLALARALIREPSILLLDEPLSNLDAKLREEMRVEIKALQARFGITTLYVTHDQAEALLMSDRIALFDTGRIVQEGTPREIYSSPRTRFAANFVGASNFIPGRQTDSRDRIMAEGGLGMARVRPVDHVRSGEHVTLFFRPEDVRIHDAPPADSENVARGTLRGVNYLGDYLDLRIDLGGHEIHARQHPSAEPHIGSELHVEIPAECCIVLPKE
jgi:iron(III) transport system ATP-binding protein